MRVLASLSGIAGVNISGEQTAPKRGVLQKDVIAYITNLYRFAVSPPVIGGPGVAILPLLQFQSGSCTINEESIPVTQIIATVDGDAVSAQDTALADKVLSDYLNHLEDDLHFRFREWNPVRFYQSFLLVELDSAFVNGVMLSPLQRIVNEVTNAKIPPYAIKRIALGQDALNYTSPQPTIHQLLSRDYIIERRANEPMESNRFFCTAPLTTEAHIESLEKIEAAAT